MRNAAADELRSKIARLIQERGWNQEQFARIAGVSRLTVRGLFQPGSRRLHNDTLAKCARALDVTVYDLCELPLPSLLQKMEQGRESSRAYEEATQPELLAWARDNGAQAGQLSIEEWDELLSLQGTGGPLTAEGVERFVDQIERKRRLMEKMAAIAGTEHIDLLEKFVEMLYDKIRPYRDRK